MQHDLRRCPTPRRELTFRASVTSDIAVVFRARSERDVRDAVGICAGCPEQSDPRNLACPSAQGSGPPNGPRRSVRVPCGLCEARLGATRSKSQGVSSDRQLRSHTVGRLGQPSRSIGGTEDSWSSRVSCSPDHKRQERGQTHAQLRRPRGFLRMWAQCHGMLSCNTRQSLLYWRLCLQG